MRVQDESSDSSLILFRSSILDLDSLSIDSATEAKRVIIIAMKVKMESFMIRVINPVNEKTSVRGFQLEAYHQFWLTNLAERSNITTRIIGNTNGLRVVSRHILHIDFIYATILGCILVCEELFVF